MVVEIGEEEDRKTVGRRKEVYRKGFTIEEVIELYERLGSSRKVATALSLSPRTILTYLREVRYDLKRGRKKGEGGRPPHLLSQVEKWVEDNPGVELPRSVSKIAEITGCSPDAVRGYISRRRAKVLDFAESLPDLTELDTLLLDLKGRPIPTQAIKWYITSVDRFSLDIIVRAYLKNGKAYTFRNSMEDWKEILQNG